MWRNGCRLPTVQLKKIETSSGEEWDHGESEKKLLRTLGRPGLAAPDFVGLTATLELMFFKHTSLLWVWRRRNLSAKNTSLILPSKKGNFEILKLEGAPCVTENGYTPYSVLWRPP